VTASAPLFLARALFPPALLAALLALGPACATETPGELDRVEGRSYRVLKAHRERAVVTGVGCGGSREEALAAARRIAHYNLRSVTGSGTYRVVFRELGPVGDGGAICLEVEARAVPERRP